MPETLERLLSIAPAATLVVGILLLLAGGHWLVEGAVRIARRLGVSTLLIGLTVVAFGTSAPELAFNLTAVVSGTADLSFGNVIGSNIANIGLVVGAVALYRPLAINSRVVKKELPLLVVVSVGIVVLAWAPVSRPIADDGVVIYGFTRIDGMLLVGTMALCGWAWYRLAQQDRRDPLAAEAAGIAGEDSRAPLPRAIGLFVFGLVLLVAGGKAAQTGAVGIADALGMTKSLVGLTIVAVATSLPELAASAIAARKGHSDLAIGNVVGSNIFNILLVLGTTSLVAPVPVPGLAGWWDLAVMLALTLVLLPIALKPQRRVTRLEGALLLCAYACFIAFRVWRD